MSAPDHWDIVRAKLLAAASAAGAAVVDIAEAARGTGIASHGNIRQGDTLTALVDALRLTLEAVASDRAGKEVFVERDGLVLAIDQVLAEEELTAELIEAMGAD